MSDLGTEGVVPSFAALAGLRGGDRGRCSQGHFSVTELGSDAHKAGGADCRNSSEARLSNSCFPRVQGLCCFAGRGRYILEGRAKEPKKPLEETCPSFGPLIFKNL